MGMGLVGAGGAAGGAAAIQALRDELLKRAQLELENKLALRGADRADRQLDMQGENNRLLRDLQERQFSAEQAQQTAVNEDRQIQRAQGTREMLPPETFIPEDDPSVGMFQKAGLSGTLRMMEPTQPMGQDFQGPMEDGETPQQAQVGRVRGRLTMPTAKQAATATDDARMQTALEGQQATQAGMMDIRQQLADIAQQRANQPAGQTSPDAGWQLKEVTDPSTNKTRMVRVNSRTGEVQPVALPDGVQPGGSRQTRLSAGQQDDLATMKTVEDMVDAAANLGDATKWAGVGGMGQGTVGGFMARNLGTGTAEAETLRNYIGNVQATIAKLRGGTSFTANEQALLEQYTPTINESALTLKAKMASLKQFIQMKRQNTLLYAGGGDPAAATPDAAPTAKPSAADLIKKYGGGGAR